MVRQPRRRARAAGFSLVELILAVALGLVVVTGIVQLFVGNSRTYTVLNGQARMQESARFALEFIAQAARSAGYFGCAPERQNIVKGLRGAWELVPEFDVTRMVQGYEGGAGGWSPAITTLPRTVGGTNTNVYVPGNGINTDAIRAGTDVLAFRSLQRPSQRLADTLQPDGNPVVTAPDGNPGFGVGDIVMVANCEQGAVFRVTDMVVNGNQASLIHATSATGNLYENGDMVASPTGNISYTLSLLGRSYGPEAVIGAVETTYFFIAPGAGLDTAGAAVPALWQKVGRAAPVELVQGVEDLQVLYGIDTTLTDGVANANRYVTFNNIPNVNDPRSVVSVRVAVTVTSVDRVADDGDLLRRTFSKTILLRNSDPEV